MRATPAPDGFHVFYVHSGITYTVAQAAVRQLGLAAPLLIGGRAIAGPGIARTVVDDGMWDIARTLVLLRLIADLAPPGRPIHLYLPHTWMLLGQLIKASRRIERFHYLEEGYTSASPMLIDQPQPTPVLCAGRLVEQLENSALMRDLDICPSAVEHINASPARAFDSVHPGYGGAFACTPRAFGPMPHVQRLALQADAPGRAAQLLVIPGLINLYESRLNGAALLENACRRVLAMADALAQGQSAGQTLLIKLHPRDEAELPADFLAALATTGMDYRRYCMAEGIDPHIEPALRNFERYHICGLTAVELYVRHFLGVGRVMRHPAFG